MNVNPHEVQKFDDLAGSWWDPNGFCKPLHELNPLRFAFIQSCCALSNQRILDVGCGGGILTEALSRCSPYVVGLDQSAKALEVATLHAQSLSTPPHYEFATAENYAEQHPASFDVVTCMEMLEHVPSPISIIQACERLLKPGGDLFFSTINRTPKAFLHAIVGAEYVLRLLPRGTHDYEHFIRPSELTAWCHANHLRVQQFQGLSYRLLSQTYYHSSDVSVNYLVHFKKETSE